MKKDLQNISKRDWDILVAAGMLWELFPEAPSTWYELKGKDVSDVAHKKNIEIPCNR